MRATKVPSKRPKKGSKERHPDFDSETGREIAVVHGAESPVEIEKRAEVVHSALLEHAPYLDEPRFIPAVDRYLKAAARESLLHDHIEKLKGDVPMRVYEQATACSRLAAKLGSDLGLDPIGHARIRALSSGAAAVEQSLADLAAEGRGIAERRKAAQTIDTTAVEDEPMSTPESSQSRPKRSLKVNKGGASPRENS
jgi:hypothetical protein